MSTLSSALSLDVVASFGVEWSQNRVSEFCKGLSATLERVEHNIRDTHLSIQLRLRCVSSKDVATISDESIRFAVGVLDISDCDMALALVAGRLQGSGVPRIVVCRADSKESASRMGIHSPNLITYASMDQLFLSDSLLQQELLRAVSQARIQEELVYQFWFPRETSTIWVVCPQIDKPGEFADRSSADYTYLDNLGDTDALLEVMVLLSQYYPNATIERFSSDDLPEGHTSSNLVVIGGPGSTEIRNEICKDMMSRMHSHVAYSPDCEQMTVTEVAGETIELSAEYRPTRQGKDRRKAGLRADWGYFAKFKNPINENATVILINGIHTAGVLGSVRVFSERREALRNFDAVLASGIATTSFECYFQVPVLNAQVSVPSVDRNNIFALDPRDQRPTRTPPSSGAERRPSVRVLFIAGDRGGARVNQLQIPNEYHAIQASLRACKHRDVIALANPILGATRERLALAYRERPTIVHFAGHGDEWSLSIIADRGVLINETPLDAKQLCEFLGTMQDPVRLCVLNACDSAELAQQLVSEGVVKVAVGWSAKVSDSEAIAFSAALYGALGDGRTLSEAISVARVASGTGSERLLVAGADSDKEVSLIEAGNGA
jgi:CHAT domain